ncbi:MAG TPA: RNA polymerase sigma-70 factor [Prolixibacteraceae bacterium]|nr:RNA polymerase sigma-70 factor [Prolixibacteraceae bacterium]HUM89325.1 RNA polymerase sigma-70 factor [Prolixibacteraceae bacterium]
MELSDKHIVDCIQHGDEQVFELFFRNYYERLCNYANTILNDMDEAEEMVQNAFLTIWERRESFEVHTSLKSYLYRAVYNSSLNSLKHKKVQHKHEQYYKQNTAPDYESATSELMENELQQLAQKAIEQLPPQCKMVFTLSRVEQLTYAEIAEQMNISAKTVENHMVRALRFLREKLKDYLPLLIWVFISKN